MDVGVPSSPHFITLSDLKSHHTPHLTSPLIRRWSESDVDAVQVIDVSRYEKYERSTRCRYNR